MNPNNPLENSIGLPLLQRGEYFKFPSNNYLG